MAEVRWDGLDEAALCRLLDAPRVVLRERVASTMDVAHALGEDGAPSGALVLADVQEAGRGRGGRQWVSEGGQGIWLTMLGRPQGTDGLGVLSLRVGLRVAEALDAFATGRVLVKWPNDLYAGGGKVAGILIETRWREERPEWIAVGVGINVRGASLSGAGSLRVDVPRVQVLAAVVPAVRDALRATGELLAAELEAWNARDLARGRIARLPVEGAVAGLATDGALLVQTSEGLARCASGSLELAEGV